MTGGWGRLCKFFSERAFNASCEVSVRGVAKIHTFHSEKRQKTPRIKIVYDFGPASRSASQE